MSFINERAGKKLQLSGALAMVLFVSTLSHAETTETGLSAPIEDNAEHSSLMTSKTPESVSESLGFDKSTATRQAVASIIISEDYAIATESSHWQYINKSADKSDGDLSWLEKWLESIFGQERSEGGSTDAIALVSLLLKILLIAALIAFIIWVLRRAGYLAGWTERIRGHTGRRSQIQNNQAGEHLQGWEQLSAHEQIPAIVSQLLQDNKLIAAASVLYRGSLRWLTSVQRLPIAVADTEQQCLAQIQQLNDSKPHLFISHIISLWLQAAYQRPNGHNAEQLSVQLQRQADQWLAQLPTSAAVTTRVQLNSKLNSKNSTAQLREP